ncbi:peptidoglycan DD-metalloendopeptidase family protein [Candidatus Parcubacteria bacterium]|nr:peptidoglycan DD-metalloendopeptidase family protein [Candidatus Parcubacteria bacterium]
MPESAPISGDSGDHTGSGQISTYVVHKGDSLSQIAKMFGVSVNTIIWGNDLRTSVISEGQTLLILPVTGVRHIVKAGDTLKSIAAKYKGDLEEIRQFNDLSDNPKLAVGEVVIVPDGEIANTQQVWNTSSVHGASGVPSYEGYYAPPLVSYVKTQGLHGYNGVDLADPIGTAVHASASGDILISRDSGWNGGYGKYVVIAHDNGTQTLYAHLNETIVFAGYHVTKGQLIGFVGNTGKSTGPHLHFEVRGARNPF